MVFLQKKLLLITRENIDLDNGRITVPGHYRRELQLSDAIIELFTGNGDTAPVWKEMKEIVPDREELDARLQLAALEGELPDSDRITAEDLRHTYLVYLVRQGVRLSELERIVGKMPSKILLSYRLFLPEESDRPMDEISSVYPLYS